MDSGGAGDADQGESRWPILCGGIQTAVPGAWLSLLPGFSFWLAPRLVQGNREESVANRTSIGILSVSVRWSSRESRTLAEAKSIA
jgi:hypothetical protein